VNVSKGKGVIDGAIETKSDDIAMSLGGSVELKDPFRRSRFDLVLKMVVADVLQERSEPIRLMVQTAHKNARLDPPETGLGFRLTGPFSRPRFTGIKTKTREERLRERRDSARKRAERLRKRKEDRSKKKKKPKVAEKKPEVDSESEEVEQEPPEARLGEPIQIEPLEPGAGLMPASPSSTAAPQPEEQPPPEEEAPQPTEEAPQPEEGGQGQTGAGQQPGETGEAQPERIIQ